MYINSQFFISYYPGAQPLDLMSVPQSISGNPESLLIYNKFIQNIVTIYGSQNNSGVIPVFWTRRDDKDSGFGTGQVSFSPSENSTLQKLQPKSGYYFILRDESSIPLQIPVVSGEVPVVLETSENFDISSISANHVTFEKPVPEPGQMSSEPTHSQIVEYSISNLENGQTYSYEFLHVDNNWPVTITPASGTFTPSSNNAKIQANLTFCPTTGCCPDGTEGLLNYPDSLDYFIDKKSINYFYQIYRMKVSPVAFEGTPVISDDIKAICKDCLPNTRIFSMDGLNEFANYKLETEGENTLNWNFIFDNLTPNKSYDYEIDVLDANWPVIFNTPTSGNFTSTYDRSYVKSMSISFCPTPSFCPIDNVSVFDYTPAAKFVENYYITMSCVLREISCENPEEFKSYNITVYCNNCL